jgi:hypothetical protein
LFTGEFQPIVVPRILINDTAEDQKAAQPLISQILYYPLKGQRVIEFLSTVRRASLQDWLGRKKETRWLRLEPQI